MKNLLPKSRLAHRMNGVVAASRRGLTLAVLLIAVCLAPPLAATAAPAALTNQTLSAYISAGLNTTSDPAIISQIESITSAGSVASYGASYLQASCNFYVNLSLSAHPKPCFYGDPKSSNTVVLWGDSFANEWIPALDVAGKQLHFKLAVFAFSGCATPFLPANTLVAGPSFDAAHVAACIKFHQTLPAAVHALHPVAVMSASGSPSYSPSYDQMWVTAMASTFAQLAPGATAKIVIGTGPHFDPYEPVQCASQHLTSLKSCTFGTQPTTWSLLPATTRDATLAKTPGINLIPASQWQCVNQLCPVDVDHHFVYADHDHITTKYALWIAPLMATALKPLLHLG